MKKSISTLLMIVMTAISIPILAGTASSQTRTECRQQRSSRSQRDSRTNRGYSSYNDGYYNDGYYNDGNRQPNIYDRHRKIINIAGGAAGGALLGGLLGGKKGALIGAAAGVAGGAIFTSKQKSRNYPRY